MASLALHQTQMALSMFRIPFARPLFAGIMLPSFLATPKPFSWALPTLQSLLDLFPPFLLAVPKKKTSHSRKAMRSANKGLKDKKSTSLSVWHMYPAVMAIFPDVVHCPGCGSPKMAHHICPNCYSSLNRAWKAKSRQGEEAIPSVSLS